MLSGCERFGFLIDLSKISTINLMTAKDISILLINSIFWVLLIFTIKGCALEHSATAPNKNNNIRKNNAKETDIQFMISSGHL